MIRKADDGHRYDGTLIDHIFSPCRICGRPLSSHKANQMPESERVDELGEMTREAP